MTGQQSKGADLFSCFPPPALIAVCLTELLLLCNVPRSTEIITHDVVSKYQAERTQIQVLLPETLDHEHRYRVVYVLPVNTMLKEQREYGDVLLELQRLGLHNKHNTI